MLWFSLWHFPRRYEGSEPAFVQSVDHDLTLFFDQNAEAIQQEVIAYWSSTELSPYFHQRMVSKKDGYKTLSLRWWSIEFYKNQCAFPILSEWLRNRPDVLTLSINVLEPRTRISPHMGDTNGVVRGHFGIQIPEGLPKCGIRVKRETKAWKDKAWLWFTDAYEHETWNESETSRIVLLMDVIKPVFRTEKRRICAHVMMSQFLQKRQENWAWFQKVPPRILRVLARILMPLVYVRIWMLNFFKTY